MNTIEKWAEITKSFRDYLNAGMPTDTYAEWGEEAKRLDLDANSEKVE